MGDDTEAPMVPTIAMRPPAALVSQLGQQQQPTPPAGPPPAPPIVHHTWLDRVRLHVGAWWAGVRARMHHHAAATMTPSPAAPPAPPPAIGVEFGALDSEHPALVVAGEGLGTSYDTRLRG